MKLPILIVLLVCFFKGSSSLAAVFMGPSADLESFQRYLLQSQQQSYTDWFQQQYLQKNSEVHEKVAEFVQALLTDSSAISETQKQDWERLRATLHFQREDRELLALLAEKKLHQPELCRALVLEPDLQKKLEKPFDLQGCKEFDVTSLRSILNFVDSKDLVSIDGVVFEKEKLPKSLPGGNFRWKRLSNRYQDVEFFGSADGFAQALQSKSSWVEGDCTSAKLTHPDFSVLTSSKIYFSDQCTPPGLPPVRNFKTWAAENKKLLWGVGIVLGVFAAYQLRDKTLVITTP